MAQGERCQWRCVTSSKSLRLGLWVSSIWKTGHEDEGRVGVSRPVIRVPQEADSEMKLGTQGRERQESKVAGGLAVRPAWPCLSECQGSLQRRPPRRGTSSRPEMCVFWRPPRWAGGWGLRKELSSEGTHSQSPTASSLPGREVKLGNSGSLSKGSEQHPSQKE